MILYEHLESTVEDAVEQVTIFYDEFPYGGITDSVDDLHNRLLATAQTRFYLSGLAAELILSKAHADKEVARKQTILSIAEADATPRLKVGDYATAKEIQGKLTAATLDEYLELRKAQGILTDVRATLDFIREHLREFERQTYDLKMRINLLYSDG